MTSFYNLKIDPVLRTELKIKALKDGLSMEKALTLLIQQYVNSNISIPSEMDESVTAGK